MMDLKFKDSYSENMKRVMCLVGVLLCLCWRLQAQLKTEYFHSFNGPQMRVLDAEKSGAGSYPWLARVIQQEWLKSDPTGEGHPMSDSCEPRLWHLRTLSSKLSAIEDVTEYLGKCEKEMQLDRGWLHQIWGTLFLKLYPDRHPYARHVMLELPDGTKVKGLLALKGDSKPRPLILFRLGIFSNTEEFFPERYLFMQLFEQSPFHMLVLESTSGSEFLENNQHVSLGGFDEGVQNYLIARELLKPNHPLSGRIHSIHMVGISLGGHGSFYTALLNGVNPQIFSSFLGICPLVHFAETLDYHRSQKWSMELINFWSRRRLSKIERIYPEINKDRFIESLVDLLNQNPNNSRLSLISDLHWPDPRTPQKSFLERLNFWPHWKGIKTPFLVLATQEDPIVPYPINSEKVVKNQMNLMDPNLKGFELEKGIHCSLPSAYDWRATATLLQTYILKNSKGWQIQTPHWRSALKVTGRQEYSWDVNKNGVYLKTKDGDEEFPLERIEMYPTQKPLSPETQSLLKRWFHQNMNLESSEGSGDSGSLWTWES